MSPQQLFFYDLDEAQAASFVKTIEEDERVSFLEDGVMALLPGALTLDDGKVAVASAEDWLDLIEAFKEALAG